MDHWRDFSLWALVNFLMESTDVHLLCRVCGDLVTGEMVNAPVDVVSLYFPRCALE